MNNIICDLVKIEVCVFGKDDNKSINDAIRDQRGRVRFYFEDDIWQMYTLEVGLSNVQNMISKILNELTAENINVYDQATTFKINLSGDLAKRFSGLEIGYEKTACAAHIAVDVVKQGEITVNIPATDKSGRFIVTETKQLTWCDRLHITKEDAERYWSTKWKTPQEFTTVHLSRQQRLLGDSMSLLNSALPSNEDKGEKGEGDE